MPLKTILFLGLFALCTVGALSTPLLGILGYVGHYCVGPEQQWWEAPIGYWGLRYSFTLAAATAIGLALNHRRLRLGRAIMTRHEWLLVGFLGIVWLSWVIGEETQAYTIVDHPTVKMTKVILFTLMMTHIVTTSKNLDWLLWVLVGGAFILGYQAYTAPRWRFFSARLEGVGGPDFAEANFLAAFLAAVLPLIGIQFLRSGWIGKLAALVSGVFATNAIILTRSRGALVGLAGGALVALMGAPRQHRRKVLIALVLAVAGGFYLTDPGFIRRAGTITTDEEERDASAGQRLETWEASVALLADHPFGVGAGNFFQAIGRYNEKYTGRDAHSTVVRCYSELGIQGLLLFGGLIFSAIMVLRQIARDAERLPPGPRDQVMYVSYGVMVSLATALGCTVTMTLLYNEFLWWFLALPVCLQRALQNLNAATLDAAPRPSR